MYHNDNQGDGERVRDVVAKRQHDKYSTPVGWSNACRPECRRCQIESALATPETSPQREEIWDREEVPLPLDKPNEGGI